MPITKKECYELVCDNCGAKTFNYIDAAKFPEDWTKTKVDQQVVISCGPTCLATLVLGHYGLCIRDKDIEDGGYYIDTIS